MDGIKQARKAMYAQIRRDHPGIPKQQAKQLAYDTTQQAVKNLEAEQHDGR